jgi:hypothetical protein
MSPPTPTPFTEGDPRCGISPGFSAFRLQPSSPSSTPCGWRCAQPVTSANRDGARYGADSAVVSVACGVADIFADSEPPAIRPVNSPKSARAFPWYEVWVGRSESRDQRALFGPVGRQIVGLAPVRCKPDVGCFPSSTSRTMSGARKARSIICWTRRLEVPSVSAISAKVSPALILPNQAWARAMLRMSVSS